MAILKKWYSDENTKRNEIRSVERTSVSFDHKIIKSTDSDLPEGLSFQDDNGVLIAGVHEPKDDKGVFVAMVLTFQTTLEEVQASNVVNFKSSADSALKEIDIRSTDPEAEKQDILSKESLLLSENEACETIQEAENLTWN